MEEAPRVGTLPEAGLVAGGCDSLHDRVGSGMESGPRAQEGLCRPARNRDQTTEYTEYTEEWREGFIVCRENLSCEGIGQFDKSLAVSG